MPVKSTNRNAPEAPVHLSAHSARVRAPEVCNIAGAELASAALHRPEIDEQHQAYAVLC